MAKKGSKAQRLLRERQVMEMLLSGHNRPAILQFASENWGVVNRTTDDYIKAATAEIATTEAKARENAISKHLARRNLYRKKAIAAGDLRLALEIDRDEAKLMGLYPSDKVDINQSGEIQVKVLKGVSVDDL